MSSTLKKIANSFIQNGIFDGCVILAGNADQDFFEFQYGLADRLAGTAFTRNTVIDVSSVSKPVGTASAVALCMERGLLVLQEDFRKYVPDYQGKIPEAISLLQLASHTSGLQQSYPLEVPADMMVASMKHCDAIYPPGVHFQYLCLNFHILGWAVENVSGQKLDDFAGEHIFTPLKMTDTAWGKPLAHTLERLARTGRHLENPPEMIFDRWARVLYPRICGNAGIFTSASDLAKFARMMLRNGKGIFKKETAELFFRVLTSPGLPRRTFGWNNAPEFIPRGMSTETIYHTGSSGQSFWIDRTTGQFLIILTNLFGEHDTGIRARFDLANAAMECC